VLVLVHRSPFAAESNVKRAPRSLLLTEPCYTPLKILSLPRRNDGRGRPSHNVETCPCWRTALKAPAIPYYQPSFRSPLRVLCASVVNPLRGSGFGVWNTIVSCSCSCSFAVHRPVIAALEALAILTTNLYSGSPFRVLCASVVNPSPSVTSGTQL
jgi:hypothetical protein